MTDKQMTSAIPLLIDTDPGVDDALALLMAFNDPRHDVVGLTIAAGNVGLGHTVRNALKLCEAVGSPAPVFAGTDEPLLPRSGHEQARDAAYVHGRDGFGDSDDTAPARQAEAEHAALAMLRLSHLHAGKLLLVALGPLTNLALALKLDPSLPQRIARCVVMGGAVSAHGNITAAAEFNIAFDPEAAHLVLAGFEACSGAPRIELVDWEAVMAHGFAHARFERWLSADSPRARFYDAISRRTRVWASERRGDHWHSADALAMALALQPEGALEVLARPVAIELDGRHTRGATVVDWLRHEGRPDNAALLMRYDQARFEALLQAALAAG